MNSRDYSTISSSFASIVELFLKKFDNDSILAIFPPQSAFKIDELIKTLSDESNYKYYEEAKRVISEYAMSLRRNGGFFFPVEDIISYLSKYFHFEKSLEFIRDKKMYYYLLKISFFDASLTLSSSTIA